MIFLPVVFMCLVDNVTCEFNTLSPTKDLASCVILIQEISKKLEDSPIVGVYRATCVSVNNVYMKGKEV